MHNQNEISGTSIVSEQTIELLGRIQKIIQKIVIWIVIGTVALGAIIILVAGTTSGEIIGKFVSTLAIVALMLAISINNFHRIASRKKDVQIFAIIGFITNLVWALLWILLCWNPEWGATINGYTTYGYPKTVPSAFFKIALISSFVSGTAFISSNFLAFSEGNKRSLFRPIKIASVICVHVEMCLLIFFTIVDFNFPYDSFYGRLGALAGFIGFAIIVMAIILAILARSVKKAEKEASTLQEVQPVSLQTAQTISQQPINSQTTPTTNPQTAQIDNPQVAQPVVQQAIPPTKTDAELRAEIEEQVRREMIEKEVRARLTSEASNQITPNPLQQPPRSQ